MVGEATVAGKSVFFPHWYRDLRDRLDVSRASRLPYAVSTATRNQATMINAKAALTTNPTALPNRVPQVERTAGEKDCFARKSSASNTPSTGPRMIPGNPKKRPMMAPAMPP